MRSRRLSHHCASYSRQQEFAEHRRLQSSRCSVQRVEKGLADKPLLFTFHKVRRECEQANADAWRAFLEFYSPLFLCLLEIYLPGKTEVSHRLLGKLLGELAENNFQRLRSTSRQSEREFLADLRVLLLDLAAKAAVEITDTTEGGRLLEVENVKKLLEGLPLMHQEMLFFKLAGYTDLTLERMLRVAPRVAEKAFERLGADYSAAQRLERDRCPWPVEWLAVLREAHRAKQENCPEQHQFLRIHDGQVSWYDKEPVEKHVAGCLHCLERWTALREVGYWRRIAPPTSTATIEEFLRVLAVSPEPQKSLFRRVFG